MEVDEELNTFDTFDCQQWKDNLDLEGILMTEQINFATTTIVTIVRVLYQNSLHLERILMLDQIDDNDDDISEYFHLNL